MAKLQHKAGLNPPKASGLHFQNTKTTLINRISIWAILLK